MLIAIIVIVGISLLILGHELGHFVVAKRLGLRVDEFGFGFPPRITAWKRGETEYSINWLPFGGFVRIAGEHAENNEHAEGLGMEVKQASDTEKDLERKRLFSYQSASRKIFIIVAGVAVNFLLGWWFLSAALMIGTPSAVIVTGVASGSPAAEARIVAGDAIAGFATAKDFIAFVNVNRGMPIELRMIHGAGESAIQITPRVNPPRGEGAIGVEVAEAGESPRGLISAVREGLTRSALIVWLTVKAMGSTLAGLITQGVVPVDVVGPLGIISFAQRASQLGFVYLLQLISLISLNLVVINLIPFPVLDGGRILLVLIEKIKGFPIARRTEALVNSVGFVALLAAMVLITVRDIIRF